MLTHQTADIRKNLEDAKELLIYAENVALSPEGPAVYEATLEKRSAGHRRIV